MQTLNKMSSAAEPGTWRVILSLLFSSILVLTAMTFLPIPASAQPTDWTQVSEDGFGDFFNEGAWSMAEYKGKLYAGTYNRSGFGCHVWAYDGSEWAHVMGQDPEFTPGTGPGFGNPDNRGCYSMAVYKDLLCVGTLNNDGCEIWAYDGANWERIDPQQQLGGMGFDNDCCECMVVYNNRLFIGTSRDLGCQIWSWGGTKGGRHTSGDWKRVKSGWPHEDDDQCGSMAVYGGFLFAAVTNPTIGCQIWRYDLTGTGGSWDQVNLDGFGDENDYACFGMAEYNGRLYATTTTMGAYPRASGVWEYEGGGKRDWTLVNEMGFGNLTYQTYCMKEFNGRLYVGTKHNNGAGVWEYDGVDWVQANQNGFGSWENEGAASMAEYQGQLYVGTASDFTGCEVWRMDASTRFYFAEGSTGVHDNGFFETFILVQNPGNENATVNITYMTGEGLVPGPEGVVGPGSRATVSVADTLPGEVSVASVVESDQPIIAERSMYWNDTSRGVFRQAAHDSIGAIAPSLQWYLAEGSTGGDEEGFFETYIMVQNPGGEEATVNITYLTPHGEVYGPKLVLKPQSARSVNVAETVDNEWSVSTMVTSDRLVVAERSVYFTYIPYGKQEYRVYRQCAQNSIGVTAPETEWYLAEGSTGGEHSFETWILLMNPGAETVVNLTYMTEYGEIEGPEVRIGYNERVSIDVSETVPDTWSVSTKVESKYYFPPRPIVAERSMYWNIWSEVSHQCAHSSIGVTTPATEWCLAEGSTGQNELGNFETWVLIQNPGSEKATGNITYMTPAGEIEGPSIELEPGTRQTIEVAATVPEEWSVSTMVTTDEPVIAERSMYWNSSDGTHWQCAHDSIGFAQ